MKQVAVIRICKPQHHPKMKRVAVVFISNLNIRRWSGFAVVFISNLDVRRWSGLPSSSLATSTPSKDEAGCRRLHWQPRRPEIKRVAIVRISKPQHRPKMKRVAVVFISNLDVRRWSKLPSSELANLNTVRRWSRLLSSSLATSTSGDEAGCRHLH